MFLTNFIPQFTLGVLLLQGALGTPVSTTQTTLTTSYAGAWDATLSPSPTSSSSACLSSSSSATCSRSICVDNVNECGQMYGGCFLDPACTGGTVWPTFSKPPCSSQICTQSICADYVNECGMQYGGCFLDPHCTGGTAWPTFSKPPCPTAVLSSITSFSHSPICTQSICVDKINSCGQTYGGCFLDPKCTGGSAWPTFTPPPCPTSTSSTSKYSSSLVPYSSPTSTCKSSTISKSSSSASCSRSICADYINECGQPYGGCFLDPHCTGGTIMPTFSKPPCNSTITSSPTSSIPCTRSLCIDSINECGIPYGGCFLDPKCTGGSVFPTFSKPPCPTATNTGYPTVTAVTTLIYYTTVNPPGETVTVIKTSTSSQIVPVASIIANSTHFNTTTSRSSVAIPSAPAPSTPTTSATLFTGAGVQNFAEVGIIALVAAAGAIFL